MYLRPMSVKFAAALATGFLLMVPRQGLPQPRQVERGDTLYTIAEALLERDGWYQAPEERISAMIEELIRRNPQITNVHLIHAGATIDVPPLMSRIPPWSNTLYRAVDNPTQAAPTREPYFYFYFDTKGNKPLQERLYLDSSILETPVKLDRGDEPLNLEGIGDGYQVRVRAARDEIEICFHPVEEVSGALVGHHGVTYNVPLPSTYNVPPPFPLLLVLRR